MSTIFNVNVIAETNVFEKRLDDLNQTSESFFTMSLNHLTESRKMFNEYSKELYRAISESNNDYDIINESFSEFFNNIVKIIEKFLKFVKSMVEKFIAMLFTSIKSERYLEKNKDKFRHFNTSHEFDIEGFEYTIEQNVPLITAAMEFKEDFFNMRNPQDIKSAYSAFNNKLQDDFYDAFRATVIGMDGDYIPSGQYASELFRVFRNGSDSKDTVTVTSHHVTDSLDRYTNYKKTEKAVKDTKDAIEKQYEDIKKFVKSSVNIKYGPGTVITSLMKDIDGSEFNIAIDKEAEKYLMLFIKAKTSQIEQMCNIHTLAFGAKLDALKECYIQDRTVLYKALSKVANIK